MSDESYTSYQQADYDNYLNDLGLEPGVHTINSIEYDPVMDVTNFSYTTMDSGDFDAGFLDDFNIGVIDGDSLNLGTDHMSGDFDDDYSSFGSMPNFIQDFNEGQTYWQSENPNISQDIQSRIDNQLNANAQTVVFTTLGEYGGAYIGGNYFPPNAYPGLGGLKVGGGKVGGFMPHMPLRQDRPPMVSMPSQEVLDKIPDYVKQNYLKNIAQNRIKAELGQYYFGNATPEEANYFIQMYIREYAVNELGVPLPDAMAALSSALDEGFIKNLPFTYNKDTDGEYEFTNVAAITEPSDLQFFNTSDSDMKTAGELREVGIAMGGDVYSEIPSNNVPDKFNVAVGARIYRTSNPDEFGNYNYYVDKIENDTRLSKLEKKELNESNDVIVNTPTFISEGERQAARRSKTDSLLLNQNQKDSFTNNVLQAGAALLGDPIGELGKKDLEKAIWNTATSLANPALGILNILSFVQEGSEKVIQKLTGNDSFNIGPDIPNAQDVIAMASNALGIDVLGNPYSEARERRQQQSVRNNYKNFFDEGLIDSDTYANLERNYQSFLLGDSLGNNMDDIEGIIYATNDVSKLLNYEIEAYTPFQRSQKYLETIEQGYIDGTVSDFHLLDAYTKHQKFIKSMGNDGNGVTVEDANFFTGKNNIVYSELPISYNIDFEIDYEFQLPQGKTPEEQALFLEQKQSVDSITYNNSGQQQYEKYYENKPVDPPIDINNYMNTDGTVNTQAYINAYGSLYQQFYDESKNNALTFKSLVNQLDGKTPGVPIILPQQSSTPLIDEIEKTLLQNTTVTQQDLNNNTLPPEFKIIPGKEKLNVDEVMQSIANITPSKTIRVNDYQYYNTATNKLVDVASDSFTPIKQYSDQQIYIDNMGRLRDSNTQEEVDPTANYSPAELDAYNQSIEDGVDPMQAMLDLAGTNTFDDTIEDVESAQLDVIRERIGTTDLTIVTDIESIQPIELPTAFQYNGVEVPSLPESSKYDNSILASDFKPFRTQEEIDASEIPTAGNYTDMYGDAAIHYEQQAELIRNVIKNEINKVDYNYAKNPAEVGLAIMAQLQPLINQGFVSDVDDYYVVKSAYGSVQNANHDAHSRSGTLYYGDDARRYTVDTIPEGGEHVRGNVYRKFYDNHVPSITFKELSDLIISMGREGENDFGGYVNSSTNNPDELALKTGTINNIIFDNYNQQIVESYANSSYVTDVEDGLRRLYKYGNIYVQVSDPYIGNHTQSQEVTKEFTGNNNGQLNTRIWQDVDVNQSDDGQYITNTLNFNGLSRPENFEHPLLTEIKSNFAVNVLTNDLLNSISELDKTTIKLQGNIQAAEASRNELAQLAEERGLSINALAEQLSGKQAEIDQAQQNESQAQRAAQAAERAKVTAQNNLSSKQAELENIQAQLDAESMNANYNETLVNSLSNQIQQATQLKVDAQSQLELAEQQLAGMVGEQTELMGILDSLQSEKLGLLSELENQKGDKADLTTRLGAKETEVLTLKGQLNTKQSELDATKLEKEAKQTELEGVNKTLSDLRLLYNGQISQLEFKQNQINTVNQQRDAIQAKFDEENRLKNKAQADRDAKQLELNAARLEHTAALLKATQAQQTAVANAEAAGQTAVANAEKKAAEDLAAKEEELDAQFAATLQEQLAAARADEQLIASGNLAARETELEEQYNADKAAAIKAEQDKAQLALDAKISEINETAAATLAASQAEGSANLAALQKDYDDQGAQFLVDQQAAEEAFQKEKTEAEALARTAGQEDITSYFVPNFSFEDYFTNYLGWEASKEANFYINPKDRNSAEINAVRDEYLADYRAVLDTGPLSEQQKDRLEKYVSYSLSNKTSRDSYAKNAIEYSAQRDAAIAETTSVRTQLTEEKAAEIAALTTKFNTDLNNELTAQGVTLAADKANALAQAEAAHKTALAAALAGAETASEATLLSRLAEQSERLGNAQQAALDSQKAILNLEAQENLELSQGSLRLELEALAAEQLANTQKDYQTQIDTLNSSFETIRSGLQSSIDTYSANETIYTNNITTLNNDLSIATTNYNNKVQQYNAQIEVNNTKQTIIESLEGQVGVISAENLQYIEDIAQAKIKHQNDLDGAFNNYNTQLSNTQGQLSAQYTEDLKTQRDELESQAAQNLADEQDRLEELRQSDLNQAAIDAEQELQDQLSSARADEQLIASGNLAAREAELAEEFESNLAAKQAEAEASYQSQLAAQQASSATTLTQELLLLQTRLNDEHKAAIDKVKLDLQVEYTSNIDAQTVAHNDQLTTLNQTHEAALAAQAARLNNERIQALASAETLSTSQMQTVLSEHAIALTNAETEAQNRYDAKLEDELNSANANYQTALDAAQKVSDDYLNSETARLNGIRDTEATRISNEYEAQIDANTQEYNESLETLNNENLILQQQVIELTPPPPMYLGVEGEDYRVIDEEERAYLDNLKEEGLSGIANNALNLPSLYNYEGNVVYDPGGFNDEDLWASDQIQELYYNGFPQTEEELVALLKANPDIFGEVNTDGSSKDAKDDLVQKIKDGIIDTGYALQRISGGKVGSTLLNIVGIFFAGGIPLGRITNALGDIFGPDTSIELAEVLQRQINNRRNFSDNNIVDWDDVYRLHAEDLPTYFPDDLTDPNHPQNMAGQVIESDLTTGGANVSGPGGTNVTGTTSYSDVDLGDPTDYLYQILRITEGPEVAESFKGKGMSDPEGFGLIAKYLDQTTIDAAIRSNAIDEIALFGTDEQRGSIDIQGEAAQKIQDIAQSLREDQALSDIELIKKYGSEAAEAIKGLDPERLEQQSMLQLLAKTRLNEALDFDPEVLPQEKLIGEASTNLLQDVRGESMIEKAVKTAALGQLDVSLTPEEAAIRERSLDYLSNAGKLSDLEQQEIKDNINTGLMSRGRMDSDYGLMQQILGRTEAELDREDRDITMGLGLYGEFDNLYGGRLARGATLGTAGESLTSARMNDNRANVAAGTELVGQLYNFENNRIEQQNAKDTMAANLQGEYDRQAAAMTGDVFGMLLSSLSTSPYGTTAISSVGGNIEAPTNLTNLIGMGSQDYSNQQTFDSTMQGLNNLQTGTRDYMNFLTQGTRDYQTSSSSGINPQTPSINNNFQGFGSLNFADKVGVIDSSLNKISGGLTGDPNTSINLGGFGTPGGLTGDPNTSIFDFFN